MQTTGMKELISERLSNSEHVFPVVILLVLAMTSITALSGGAVESVASVSPKLLNEITGRATLNSQEVETIQSDKVNLQRGLKAYYRFDKSETSYGYSLKFNGTDDWVEPSGSRKLGSYTVSVWFKAEKTNGERHIVQDSDGSSDGHTHGSPNIGVDNSGLYFTGGYNGSTYDRKYYNGLETGKWYHAVIVSDGGSSDLRAYVNGNYIGNTQWTIGSAFNLSNSSVGARPEKAKEYPSEIHHFDGNIDDFRVYERSLNSSEVQKLHQEASVSKGMIVHQSFNAGPSRCKITLEESCLQDMSGGTNDATPRNFANNIEGTESGWSKDTPLNQPRTRDFTDNYSPLTINNGITGRLRNFAYDSSSGWSSGKIGSSALDFGYEDSVLLSSHPGFDKGFTISTWVYHDDVSNWTDWQNYFNNGQVFLRKDSSGEGNLVSGFIVHNDSNAGGTDDWLRLNGDSSDALEKNKWYHIAFAWNGEKAVLYQDGEQIASKSWPKTLLPDEKNNAEPQIGRGERQSDDSHGVFGRIDDFRIYDNMLSSSQIQDIYNKNPPRKHLSHHWSFEESDRSKIYDTAFISKGILGTESIEPDTGNISSVNSTKLDVSDSLTISSWYRTEHQKFGDGSDGDVNISSKSKIDSNLKTGSRTYPDAVNYLVKDMAFDRLYTFSTPNGITAGDEVVLANLQGTPSKYDRVGQHEFLEVESVNLTENKILFEKGFSKEYGDPISQNIVVQRVPEYETLKIDGGELTVSQWSSASLETCPQGWRHYSGECYSQVGSDTWSNVRTECRNYGGEMVRIDSGAENSFVTSNYPDSWIGFRDIGGSDDGGNDGNYEWVWTFGDYYSYKNFTSSEPDINGTVHNPVTRLGSDGGWHTEFGSNNTYAGVCELNKKKGGLLAFKASKMVKTMNGGLINATGKGYTGGDCSFCGDDSDGRAGEGIGGTGKYGFYTESSNLNGGAGSYVNDNNGGNPSGGGGYGTPGQDANTGENGGIEVGTAKLHNIYFGGGGGSGSDNDNGRPNPENSNGGGVIFIQAEEAENINLTNRGIDGKTDCGSSYRAQSGGGAGGTVYIASKEADIKRLNASGGSGIYDGRDGSNNNQCLSGERSGDGGEGRIRINSISELYEEIQPNPYNTSLRSNLAGSQGEFGIGGYSDIVFGSLNNVSAGFTGLSDSNKWRSVVLTFGSGKGELFVDGEKVGSFERNSIVNTDEPLNIARGLKGKLDEVRIYNRSLSDREVRRLAFQ